MAFTALWCGFLRFAIFRRHQAAGLMAFFLYHSSASAHFIFACGCRLLAFARGFADLPQLSTRCRRFRSMDAACRRFSCRFTQTSQKSALPILPSSFTFSLQSAPLLYFSCAFTCTLQSTFTPSSLSLYTSITNFCASYCGTFYARITKPYALFLFFLYLNFTLRGSRFAPLLYQI